MKVLLTVDSAHLADAAEELRAAWLKEVPGDELDIVRTDASVDALQAVMPDENIVRIDASRTSPADFGRIVSQSVDCLIAVEGEDAAGPPDAGLEMLQALTSPCGCQCQCGKRADFGSLLEEGRGALAGKNITIAVSSTKHLTGLDGQLANSSLFDGDEQKIYRQVRTASERIRQAFEFGGRPRPQYQLKDTARAQMSLDVAERGQRIAAGKLRGGALFRGGMEILYRLGVPVRTVTDIVEDEGGLGDRCRNHDLIVAIEPTLHSWTMDELYIGRLAELKGRGCAALLVVTPETSMTLREAADNGIDGIFEANASQQISEASLWSEAGMRCARTWSTRNVT